MREFALGIGKKNFFTFGEVFVGDAEEEIARFIGRTITNQTDVVVWMQHSIIRCSLS